MIEALIPEMLNGATSSGNFGGRDRRVVAVRHVCFWCGDEQVANRPNSMKTVLSPPVGESEGVRAI
jgi:hypothetical protein